MEELKSKIDMTKLPKHVAIIMDGNGRWAKSRGEERTYGHRSAIQSVRNAINACNEIHIPYLTLYTFSTENWNRPEDEVSTLMSLLSETLLNEADEIYTKGLRLKVIGDISKMPEMVREQLQNVMDLTKDNKGGTLVLALNYGSQDEIIHAVKSIAKDAKDGKINPEDINNQLFESRLYTKDMPPVDLMIRTSGRFVLVISCYGRLLMLNYNSWIFSGQTLPRMISSTVFLTIRIRSADMEKLVNK